jgi:heme exporter protein B
VKSSGAGFVAKTALLARKDLTIEARGRDTLPPMLAFAFAVTVLLAFTLPDTGAPSATVSLPSGTAPIADVLAGFLWVTVLFAGLVGFARSFEVERQDGAIEALLLAPLDRSGLFVAKAVSNLVSLAGVQLVLLPAFVVLFPVEMGPAIVLVVVLVDIGFVSVGTLFASLAAATRSRELVLPILALPALVPVFIAAVELTSSLFAGETLATIASTGWFGILLAFDVVFGIVGALAFEFAVD